MPLRKFLDIFSFSPSKSDTRLAWIDCAKGIAIILVVYRHIAYGLIARGISLPRGVLATNDMLYSFRMPLFFLLSGIFFGKSIAKRGAKTFALSKVNTLLYPYMLWAIIQISLQILFSQFSNADRSWKDFLNILVQPRSLDQLWYLLALFNTTMLYLLGSLIFKERKIWQVVTGLILLGVAPYIQSISTFYDIALHYIFFAIGDIAATYFFREQTQKRFANPTNLVWHSFIFGLLQLYYLYHQDMNLYLFMVIALNGCLFVIMLSSYLSSKGKMKFLSIMGHYSLYIYLLHVVISGLLRAVLIDIGINNGIALLVILIPSSIFFSILAYRICMALGCRFLFVGKFGEYRTGKKMVRLSLI